MSADNRPEDEKPEDQANGDETPEEVEAEIVDEEAEAERKAAAGDDAAADPDMADTAGSGGGENDADPAAAGTGNDGKPTGGDGDKSGGMMSPGIILLVVLLLLAGFSVLSHLTRDSGVGSDAPVLAQGAEENETPVTAALDGPPDDGKTDNLSDEVKTASGEDEPAATPDRVTGLAGTPEAEADDSAAEGSDEGEDNSVAQDAEETGVAAGDAADRARERREEAIERARAAREGQAAQAGPETSGDDEADADMSSASELAQQRREAAAVRIRELRERREAEAGAADEPAPAEADDASAGTGTASAADDSAETDAALAETREALIAQREANARQSQEINALRRELDTALAEQDRKSEQRIAALEQRMERLQSQDVAAATKQAATALALANLQRQMYAGRPFTDQLAVLQRLTGETPAIRNLRSYAGDGLPPLSYLEYTFPEAARQALAASRREEATGPLGKFWANLTGLFSVRRVTPQSGDNPSAIISRAEASLEEGDLEASLRELDALEGEAREAMDGWIEEARARVAADRLLDNVSNDVLADAG